MDKATITRMFVDCINEEMQAELLPVYPVDVVWGNYDYFAAVRVSPIQRCIALDIDADLLTNRDEVWDTVAHETSHVITDLIEPEPDAHGPNWHRRYQVILNGRRYDGNCTSQQDSM